MDLFQHRYYRFNKTFLTLGGYWPYQSTCTRVIHLVVFFFVFTSHVGPQILALVKHRDDRKIIIECVITFLYEALCLTKVISMTWNVQKAAKLLNRIRTDWQVWARDQDVNILHKYAEQGRKMAIVYTVEIYTAVIVYVSQPVLPTVIDVLLKNGTAPRKFPFPADYYHLDVQKYYWCIVMYTYVYVCMGLTMVLVATEIMLIIYVQHVGGIFAALGEKLRRIGDDNASAKKGRITYALNIVDLPFCVDRHNDAIRYAILIDTTHTWTMLFVLLFGMMRIVIVALQILQVKSNPRDTVRYIGIILGTSLYLYVECHMSEILTYRSTDVQLNIHKSQWYNLAPEAQKHLRLMMMLCHVPCQLTVGKYVTLSMQSFSQAGRAAMSYFTFMRSTYRY